MDLERWARNVVANVAVPPGMERADLAQEAAVVALEAQRRHDPARSSLATYAGHRARGRCLDMLRVALRRPTVQLAEIEEPAAPNAVDDEAQRQAEIDAHRLADALGAELARMRRLLRQVELGRRVLVAVDLRHQEIEQAAKQARVTTLAARRAREAAIEMLRRMHE